MFKNFLFQNLRITVSLHLVVMLPIEFVALQTYSPSSSGKTSSIDKVAIPFLYFKSIISEEDKRDPFFFHSIFGSGSPVTTTRNCNFSPSLILKSLSLSLNWGALNSAASSLSAQKY